MEYSNAQKLAAVVSDWAHPAISQIASNKLGNLSMLRNLQTSIIQSGIVGQNYNIANEILPFVHNVVNSLVEPMMSKYLAQIQDDALPQLAHGIVDTAMQQPTFSVLGGLVEFTQDDMIELKDLLDKNLPIFEKGNSYQVIK